MVAGLEGDAASIGLWETDGDIVLRVPRRNVLVQLGLKDRD